MLSKYHTLKHVLLVPKNERAIFRVEAQDTDESWYSDVPVFSRSPINDVIFSTDQWSYTMTYERNEKFKKVSRLVGDELAEKVLDAIGER